MHLYPRQLDASPFDFGEWRGVGNFRIFRKAMQRERELTLGFWNSKEDCTTRQYTQKPGSLKRFSKFLWWPSPSGAAELRPELYKMDFLGAQKGKERKSSSSSKGFWGKKDKERRDQRAESRGDGSVEGMLTAPVSFLTDRCGLRKSEQRISVHCKLERGPKTCNEVWQLHWAKWISRLTKQPHLFPLPSSPKIAKSPPNWTAVEHDHKYSSVSEAAELDKEGAVHNPDSHVRKRSSRRLKTSPSSNSAENQEKYLKSSKGCVAEENGRIGDGEQVVRIRLETWTLCHHVSDLTIPSNSNNPNSTAQLIPDDINLLLIRNPQRGSIWKLWALWGQWLPWQGCGHDLRGRSDGELGPNQLCHLPTGERRKLLKGSPTHLIPHLSSETENQAVSLTTKFRPT